MSDTSGGSRGLVPPTTEKTSQKRDGWATSSVSHLASPTDKFLDLLLNMYNEGSLFLIISKYFMKGILPRCAEDRAKV